MRLFVAVVPPEEAVEHLDDFLDVRRSAANRAGIVVDSPLTTSRLLLVSPGFETRHSVRRFASGPSRRSSTFAADRGPRELGPRRLRYETVEEFDLGD